MKNTKHVRGETEILKNKCYLTKIAFCFVSNIYTYKYPGFIKKNIILRFLKSRMSFNEN